MPISVIVFNFVLLMLTSIIAIEILTCHRQLENIERLLKDISEKAAVRRGGGNL